jgi:uncharacterized protein YjbJ (UPF0337 family)
MDKDRIKGKAKDIAGRVERQTGEWTGNSKMQVHGAAKQAEGKMQNAVGKAKDVGRTAPKDAGDRDKDTRDTNNTEN